MAGKLKTAGNGGTKEKTPCPVTLAEFQAGAKPLAIRIGDQVLVANLKAPFATGSYGWYSGDKIVVDVGGVPCKAQVSISIVLVNSKPNGE